MAKRRIKHEEPIMGLLDTPYRETGMSGLSTARGGLFV